MEVSVRMYLTAPPVYLEKGHADGELTSPPPFSLLEKVEQVFRHKLLDAPEEKETHINEEKITGEREGRSGVEGRIHMSRQMDSHHGVSFS